MVTSHLHKIDCCGKPLRAPPRQGMHSRRRIGPYPEFRSSPAAAERRHYRDLIRKAKNLTRAERDVATALINIAFAYSGKAEAIHPGRAKLAKMARCCVRTASRALATLKRLGIAVAVKYEHGGAQATYYRAGLDKVLELYGNLPQTLPGNLVQFTGKRVEKPTANHCVDEGLANDSQASNPGQNVPQIITTSLPCIDRLVAEPTGSDTSSTVTEDEALSEATSELNPPIEWPEGPSQDEPAREATPPPRGNVVSLSAHRLSSWLGSSFMSSTRTLYPHQQRAIDALRESLRKGNRRVILQAPTAFGKTITSAKIIESALTKGKRVLFTVPRLSLVNQAIEDFEREGLGHIGALQSNHPRTDPTAPVQVATVHTLARRLAAGTYEDRFDLVIVDEAHEDYEVIRKMIEKCSDRVFIGLTATPWTVGLGRHWEDLCIVATARELVDAGFLSQFVVYAPDKPDLSKVRTAAGEYVESDLERIMGDGKLVGHVVQTWLEKGENRPTLVFGVNCAHAQRLQHEFLSAGVSAGYCDARTDSVERALLKKRFENGDVKVACSVRTLTTGIDWAVSCIVDAAPTRSEMLHVQKIGRGLRIKPGTEDLVVLDHAGNSLRLGLVTDIVHSELDKGEKGVKPKRPKAEKLPKECPSCGALHTGLICSHCGHERKPVCKVETVDGRLVEITGRVKEPTREEKQRFWSMALDLDAYRQKGGKLALGLYKSKFGVWPRGLADVRIPFDAAFQRYEQSRRIAYAKRMQKQRGAA